MGYNLRNRNFLKLLDFSQKEIKFLLDLSIDLKKSKYNGDINLTSNGQIDNELNKYKISLGLMESKSGVKN